MTCTDVDLSTSTAVALHGRHGVGDLMTYREADAKDLPFDDGIFDFVVFKSVLGVVGAKGQKHFQAKAVREIARVLKPGGRLFFAENLQGSGLHRLARLCFVPWARAWTYLTLRELGDLLREAFATQEIRSTGLTSAFILKPEFLRSGFAMVDSSLLRWAPASWNYVAYGHAVK
jgi:SAM-dependent methyltransferase